MPRNIVIFIAISAILPIPISYRFLSDKILLVPALSGCRVQRTSSKMETSEVFLHNFIRCFEGMHHPLPHGSPPSEEDASGHGQLLLARYQLHLSQSLQCKPDVPINQHKLNESVLSPSMNTIWEYTSLWLDVSMSWRTTQVWGRVRERKHARQVVSIYLSASAGRSEMALSYSDDSQLQKTAVTWLPNPQARKSLLEEYNTIQSLQQKA